MQNLLVFRIVEYGIEHEEFTLTSLINDLKLTENDKRHLRNHLLSRDITVNSPNHVIAVVGGDGLDGHGKKLILKDDYHDLTYRILPNAVFQYVDYLEIVEARKTSTIARNLSWLAIAISLILGAWQIWIGYHQSIPCQ